QSRWAWSAFMPALRPACLSFAKSRVRARFSLASGSRGGRFLTARCGRGQPMAQEVEKKPNLGRHASRFRKYRLHLKGRSDLVLQQGDEPAFSQVLSHGELRQAGEPSSGYRRIAHSKPVVRSQQRFPDPDRDLLASVVEQPALGKGRIREVEQAILALNVFR